MNPKEIKYRTVSLPIRLADDIQALIDELGYWPSLSAFAREASLEKLRRERQSLGKFAPEPILSHEPQEKKK